jgi:multiple sugar transport system substrate-binding protein
MRTISRRLLATAIGIALVATLTGAPAKAAGVVELKWLEWWVNEWGPDNHQSLVSGFEAKHPNIKVTVVDVPWMAMSQKLESGAMGGQVYDVFGTETDWVSSMVKLGYIENLDSWLKKSGGAFADSLTPMTLIRFRGNARAMCLYLIPYQFAYNVDLLKQKGLEPPRNWDQYVQTARAFRDKAKGTYGTILALKDASFIATRLFGYRLAQEGGQYIDGKGNVAFNSPQGVAALTWWKNFINMDIAAPGPLGTDQSQMGEFLAGGRVVGIIDGPFVWTKAKQIDPNIKLAYAPAWRDKTGGYLWACSGVGMSAKSQHKQEAWEFLQYLYSPEVAVKMTKATHIPWATQAAMKSIEGSDDPILSQIPGFASQDPKHNILFPTLPEADKLLDALKLAFQEAVTGKKDPKAALDEAAKIWQDALTK